MQMFLYMILKSRADVFLNQYIKVMVKQGLS